MVSNIVGIARFIPEDAIDSLLTLYPLHEEPVLYEAFKSLFQSYEQLKSVYDLYTIYFVVDCIAQIISFHPDYKNFEFLFTIGYNLVLPFSNSNELNLRQNIIRQYSVVFSYLSIFHIRLITERFQSKFTVSHKDLFILLHRFIRFSPSVEIKKVQKFLTTIQELYQKSNFNFVCANSLTTLIGQLTDPCKIMHEVYLKLYDFLKKNLKNKQNEADFLILSATILSKDPEILSQKYKEFMTNLSKKAKKKAKIESCLLSFIQIIYGGYSSRNNNFWEWGFFRRHEYKGYRFIQLLNADQDQNSSNSYTSVFFDLFLSNKFVTAYPKLIEIVF